MRRAALGPVFEFHCVTCEQMKARAPEPPLIKPCPLLSCEHRQRKTGKTLCAALNLGACASLERR